MGPVIGFVAAVFFGTAAGASAVYVLAVNLARIALLSLASKLTAPKIDLTTSAANKLLTVRSTVQPQAFTYGQDMLSGPLIWANTAGDGGNDLHRIVALHGREIEEFLAYRIDDTDIVVGGDIAAETGTVTGGQFADVMEIDIRKGTSTQTAFADMTAAFASLWTSSHRARGWSLLYPTMTLEGNNTAYENGIPQNLRALVKGHLIYDPRLDGTQVIDPTTSPPTTGTGAHREDDDTTWEYSFNPALCLADFLIWERVGMGEETDRIDWPKVATAADICEEQVAIPPCASPQVSFQDRYTCNFTFFSTQERSEVKEMLETAMLGRSIFSQGKWRMWAGASLMPDITLTAANLSGPIQMQASSGSDSRFNRVRGKHIDPSRDYSANSYPEQRNASYEAADTEVRYQTFDINTCNNAFEAQRDAILKLRMSRQQRTIVWAGNWSCFRVQPGTVVLLDVDEAGLNTSPLPKYFVTEWALQKDGSGVALTMVEELDIWDDPDCADYTIRSPTGELIPVVQGATKCTNANIHNTRLAATCTAGFEFGADGQLRYANNAAVFGIAGVPPFEWLVSPGESYWIEGTLDSGGPLATGAVGSWLALETVDREWTIEQTAPGVEVGVVSVQLATDDAGSNVVGSCTFDLQATYTTPPSYAHVSTGTILNTVSGSPVGVGSAGGGGVGDLLLVLYWKAWNAPPGSLDVTEGRWTNIASSGSSGQQLFLAARIADGTGDDNFNVNGTASMHGGQMVRFSGNVEPLVTLLNDEEDIDSVQSTTFDYANIPGGESNSLVIIASVRQKEIEDNDGVTFNAEGNLTTIGSAVTTTEAFDDDLMVIWGFEYQEVSAAISAGEWDMNGYSSENLIGSSIAVRLRSTDGT